MRSPNERLMRAVSMDDIPEAKAALDAGADLNARIVGEDSSTALITAVICCSGEVAELLVMRGADRALTSGGRTAEEFASDIVRLPSLAKAIQSKDPHDWVLAKEACLLKKQMREKESQEARKAHPEDYVDEFFDPGVGPKLFRHYREAGGSEPMEIEDGNYSKGSPRR